MAFDDNMPNDALVIGNENSSLLHGIGEPGFNRTGPLISVQELKEDYLSGLPFQSALTGAEIPEATFQRAIERAVADVETSLRIPISPVEITDRFDYHRANDSEGFGSHQLTRHPLLQVLALEATWPGRFDQSGGTMQFPTSWVSPCGDSGLIRIIPIAGATSGGDVNFFANFAMRSPFQFGANTWPNFWKIRALVGFAKDSIPTAINDLVGCKAAIRMISILGPQIFPAAAWSVAQAGITQSTSTAGPAFLAQRMAELQQQELALTDQLKTHFGTDLHFAVLG